jgi:hypothetical protein
MVSDLDSIDGTLLAFSRLFMHQSKIQALSLDKALGKKLLENMK